ncbi:MAG TPA: NDP-sugar synthase [Vicinamibacterales bacterium]|nr:NDP-sugar synthase [Vicinamibacterales bacterium]
MVPALVLTAGLATRLRPLSFVRAKAALPVAGVPLAHRILKSLADAGVTDAVLNLHHLPHTLTALTGDGTSLGLRVRYSWEVPVLGSAGGPRRALPLLRDLESTPNPESRPSTLLGTPRAIVEGRIPNSGSTFLIVNGDTLTDVDVRAVVSSHQKSGALVTIAVVPNTEPDKYGGAVVDGDGSITGFAKRGSADGSFHVIGVQVAEAEAFASVPSDVPFESFRALYPSIIASRPGSIRAFHATAEFFDIGTPADYLDTSLRIAEREGHSPGGHAQVDPSARIERSVLWDDVVVEAGAMLNECVVTDGVRIPSDTSWHGVTIRIADGELAPGEQRIGHLAIGSL